MDSRKVSIVVPMYHAEQYIRETIQSVIAQSYTEWELLLVEDGFQESTDEIMSAFADDRIHFIRLKENCGAANARNAGIAAATGQYLAFLDADDLWVPDKLEIELSFMKEQDAAFVFSGYEFGDEQAKPTGTIVKVPSTLNYKKALRNTTIFTSTVLLDRERIDKELLVMPVILSEDTAMWWKLLRNGYTAYGCNQNLVVYRRPAKSLSSNKFQAVKRIWNLYRQAEHLNFFYACFCFIGWGVRAVKRRVS